MRAASGRGLEESWLVDEPSCSPRRAGGVAARLVAGELLRRLAGAGGGPPCAGAQGPLEHGHFFTADGQFGSHNENGEEVDTGDFKKVDADTISFRSHAREFHYDGDILVDYAVDAGELTLDVSVPKPCDEARAEAYGWALSAFASGPWDAGEVPQ